MNRILFSLIALLSGLTPLVFDAALKGAALLAVATLCALAMWRASAAARHLVWIVAVIALLVVPILSLALPQWRVLPKWAVAPVSASSPNATPIGAINGASQNRSPRLAQPLEPPTFDAPSAAEQTPGDITIAASHSAPPAALEPSRTWREWLAPVWAAGFTVLLLRLLAAHILLRRAARGCTTVPAPNANAATVLAAACRQLGIRQRVTLLHDEKRTIPVVWGVFRPHLMLPAEAGEWSTEQMRSVILHELAHIKRRDTLVQWLTQFACALHWFSPLVWFAAWRLHVERERACDNLVLASGVRPSAYAKHLLDVATKLSPARWTSACGLAMARKSSLEGRLLAVLNKKLNRRSVTNMLAAIAVLFGMGIAIPVAMLRAADKEPAKLTKPIDTGLKPKAEAPKPVEAAAKLGEPLAAQNWTSPPWGAAKDGLSAGIRIVGDARIGGEVDLRIAAADAAAELKGASTKITPKSLLGFWRGTLNGEAISISFHRPPADTDVQCDIYFGRSTIGAPMSFKIAPDGKSVTLLSLGRSAGGGEYGRLTPGEAGTLQLEVTGKPAKPGKTVLTRQADEPSGEPRQKEPRTLFREWKKSAYADGKIPGALIGKLAEEVRKYAAANPNLHSGLQLPKLLPRFDASRNWTPAEAVSLLDDVAYYATDPIEAVLAVPSDALWESKVRFEIIPVKIAEWSAEKNGLRIGMRVVGGEWSVGGKVRIEMWLHNAGAKDVSFNANPGRADVGLTVAAVDSEGEERWAENGNVIIIAIPMRCTLPAGFVAKVKEFEVSFDAPDNKELAWIAPKFRDLKPGNYRLRCTWADAHPTVSGAGDWTGALATPEFDFMLGGLDDLKPAAALNGLPEDVIPELTRQSNDKYSAVACQSEKHVNFVLVYPGAISTGLSETSLDANGKWSIEGNIHLVDLAKTKAAGKNVDKRVIALKYTSGAPNTLFLDGKAYDLARRSSATLTAMLDMPGRVFMLRDEGEPFQTHRILALRSEKDLETVGKFAAHDMFMAQTYADSRRVRRMKGYVLSWDTQRPIQHSDGEHVAQLRIFPDGRVLSLSNGRRLKEFKIPAAALAELLRWLVEEGGVGEWKPIKMKIAGTGQEVEIPRVGNHWDQATEMLYFTRNGKRYGSVVESGSPGAEAFNAIRKRLREVSPKSAAAAAKPAADGYAKSGVPVADLNIPLTWSAEQNGLCLGMHIPEDANWRIGGEVKVELWVCNPGDKDVRFQWTDRRDVGIRMKLKDANGKDHDTEKWLMMVGRPNFIPTRLPAGHVMKVKEFSVKLLSHRDADDLRFIGEPRFKLPAGDYKFRCEVDLPGLGAKVLDGEWSGALKTGEIEVKLVAADAPGAKAGAKPERVKFPDEHYTKDGFPLEDLDGEGVTWNADENGLSLGYRVTGDEWRILGKDLKVELWVRNSGKEDVKFQILRRTDEGLRVKLTGADGKTHVATVVPTDNWLVGMKHHLSPGQCIKVNEFSVGLLPPDQSGQTGNELHFFVPPGWYKFVCEVEVPGFSATRTDGRQTVPGAGEWTGTLATRGLNLEVLAPSAPAPKPRIEWARVNVRKNGEVSLDRKKVTLDELRMRAAEDRAKRFVIYADGDVAYAKVTKVVEVLKAAGVTDFSLSKARVGDGKYRVANRSGSYEFDGKRKFSMCRPSEHPQWFTVMWPAEGDRPKCWLRTYPNVNAEHGGKWAVVWEPGTDVLWWVDDTDVGKMTATDPVHVIVEREGRKNNFSRDFGLPEGVKTEFRRLGFEIGRDKTPGLENVIGGNTGGQRIVSAEFGSWSIKGTVTDVDGKPLANVPVRVTTNQELKTVTTDEKGNYRVYFTLPLRLLANWRGVKAEPILEGFTERDMTMSGEFNVLLHAGEQPQRVRLAGEGNFKPGPIPRFGERDLLPSPPAVTPGKPGRADFVMLKAGEISGEIVTDDGKPAPPHFIAAATSEQRPGYNLAIVKSDAQGRFRLKGIPANKPVVFTVNPDGKPFETTKSSAAKFEPAGTHKIRIVLPSGRDANRALKVERVDDGAR